MLPTPLTIRNFPPRFPSFQTTHSSCLQGLAYLVLTIHPLFLKTNLAFQLASVHLQPTKGWIIKARLGGKGFLEEAELLREEECSWQNDCCQWKCNWCRSISNWFLRYVIDWIMGNQVHEVEFDETYDL